jgi:hypothetical protein
MRMIASFRRPTRRSFRTGGRKRPFAAATPDLQLIKDARDQVLKAGSFESYATFSQSGIGELENLEVTAADYDLAYYNENQERQDLKAAIGAELV